MMLQIFSFCILRAHSFFVTTKPPFVNFFFLQIKIFGNFTISKMLFSRASAENFSGRGEGNEKKDRKIAKKDPKIALKNLLTTISVPCMKIQGVPRPPLPSTADAYDCSIFFSLFFYEKYFIKTNCFNFYFVC